MVNSLTRQLVFRLGETGFLIELEQVVEICEQVAEDFDPGYVDNEQGVVGALRFRNAQIPVVDPSTFLELKALNSLSGQSALVLRGDDGNWALLVDQVEGIIPAEKITQCAIPALLQAAVKEYYSKISLLEDEPLIHFDVELFRASTAVGR